MQPQLLDKTSGKFRELTTVDLAAKNVLTRFRDAFEFYDPVNGPNWRQVLGSGDLVHVDGNAAAASYLVVSKDPLSAGTETTIASVLQFTMPVEIAFGLSLSQRTLGQEFSVEVVDVQSPLADVPDLAIASITQATTTLTVDTTLPHGLSIGKSIGIRDCSNPLANYPALVVASAPTPTQFTATAGPGGAIASQTIANPSGAKGFVYFRERLGRAQNGISQLFEQPTVTQASLYVRSEAGDALPSGTIGGAHAVTVGTTASVQLVNSANTYAFAPTSEYRINVQADRTQWYDGPVDSLAQTSSRLVRTQVCPDPEVAYKLRIRATNNKSLTVPNAQVVSVTKSGTTTGTFITDRPHNLATGDPVVYYGSSSSAAASFPNLAVATSVTVIDANTFTAVIGTGTAGVAYGGFVAEVQGGNLGSALGYNAVTVISAALSTLTDGTRQLLLTGSANWAGLSIGDGTNTVGCRNAVDGATLGIDGAWKVANVSTTALTLVPMPGTTPPADFVSVNCGGAVIKRTELRLHFARVFDYERERVEMMARPAGDMAAAAPVAVQNVPAVAQSGTWNVGQTGTWNVVSQDNVPYPESVANLAAGATFTGATRDLGATSPYRHGAFNAVAFADVAGTMRIEVSNDATTWRRATADAAVAAGAALILSIPTVSRYSRVIYINGAAAQGAFWINTSHTAS